MLRYKFDSKKTKSDYIKLAQMLMIHPNFGLVLDDSKNK